MTRKEKLMDEVKAANDARGEFSNMKYQEWKISFAFISPDGKAHEDEFYWLKTRSIGEALEVGNKILAKIAAEAGWKQWMIWDVGIAYGDDDPMGMF